jgi:hypothetical protein
MEFNLVDIAITVRSGDAFQLCLRLPLLGKAFAAACRENSCLCPESVCESCSRQDVCAWNHVFGQNLSSDLSAVKRFQKPSLPFVFTFPSRHDLAETASEIECRLVVVGRAIHSLDMLLEGFADILKSLDADITLVGTRDYQGNAHPLGDGCGIKYPQNLVVLSSTYLAENRIWTGTTLHIRLLSPLRLFDDGHLLRAFDFCRFAMSLLRRVSSLAYYYDANEADLDYKLLAREAAAITCTDDHFSLATGNDWRVTGLMGYGSFQGDFNGLLPFLRAGLYVHVGKGAAFGMGAYEIPCS